MDAEDLCFAGAAEQARLIRSSQVSATELVRATLQRIERVNPKINAFTEVFAEDALAAAGDADSRVAAGENLSLLGVPIALKDNLDVAGHVTSFGTDGFTVPATTDSPLVTTLRAAGAVIVGKTTLSELATWPFTETAAWGASRNPWHLDFSPGGSSGGSGAAVAAGLCGLAVGSDGLGSIRVPSSFNGTFGVKPQRDRVWHSSRDWNRLSVNGPLCPSVADAALFLDVASLDSSTGTTYGSFVAALAAPPEPRRIALAWKSAAYYPLAARLGSSQRRAVESTAEVLRSLGHTVSECEVGFPQALSTNYVLRYFAGVAQDVAAMEQPEKLSKPTAQMAALGRRVSPMVVRSMVEGEAKLAAKVNRIFDDFDVVLTPGAVEDPVKVGSLEGRDAVRTLYASGRKIPHFAPWNAIGQPAVSVPAGFSELGLPVSVQLAGPAHSEAMLLQLAAQLEAHQPWADHRPNL